MSEGWVDRKLEKLRNEILNRKRVEELALQTRAFIEARAEEVAHRLLQDIQSSVSLFNNFRRHELMGHPEIPPLGFSVLQAGRGVMVEGTGGLLEVMYEPNGPFVKYKLTKSPETPNARGAEDRGTLDFVRDGEQLWLQGKDGGKLAVPAAADYLLDKII